MYTVADNLGHAKGGLGLSMTSRYAGAESLEAKSKAVEAVVRLAEGRQPRQGRATRIRRRVRGEARRRCSRSACAVEPTRDLIS
jgi:hypothetical protein